MNSNYQEVAKKILVAVGGAENIDEVFNCIARLRFYLKDSNKINYQELELIPEVSESKFEDGQLQVLLGQNVEKYYQALINLMKQTNASRGVKKMSKAEFSFNDFLKMQAQMKMFGSMDQLLGMIPGIKMSKDDRQRISHEGEKQFKKIEVFIQSMTPEEREHPELMNSSRKKRISEGSGIPLHDLNVFINQFEQMRKMMKGFSDVKKNMGSMMGKMGQAGAKLTAHQMMKNMRRFR